MSNRCISTLLTINLLGMMDFCALSCRRGCWREVMAWQLEELALLDQLPASWQAAKMDGVPLFVFWEEVTSSSVGLFSFTDNKDTMSLQNHEK